MTYVSINRTSECRHCYSLVKHSQVTVESAR